MQRINASEFHLDPDKLTPTDKNVEEMITPAEYSVKFVKEDDTEKVLKF